MRVKVPVRSRGWGFRGRSRMSQQPTHINLEDKPNSTTSSRSRSVPSRALLKTKDISRPLRNSPTHEGGSDINKEYEVTHRKELEHSIQRLVLMSYFPSGFWSRLLTRILADDCVVEIVRNYFIIPEEVRQDPILNKIYVENKPEWVCWQTGLELRYLEAPLFSMKQVLPKVASLFDYHCMKMMLNQEDTWADIDTANSSILELSLPQDTVVIKRPIFDQNDENSVGYYQAIVLDPNPKAVCQLLALAVEHIDTLLEDWYPSLGTRFLHTSEGKMLVTRMIPCPRCLTTHNERESKKSWQDFSFFKRNAAAEPPPAQAQALLRVSQDSGMGQESPRESREAAPPATEEDSEASDDHVYAFMVEECVLLAFEGHNPKCPIHGDLVLGQIAPDTVFLDLDDRLRIQNETIKRGGLIGRGAFGFVYEAVCRPRGQTGPRNVALKMLQPINPGCNVDEGTMAAFDAAKAKWDRDPQQYASRSYCSARQELSVLIHLKHSNIVPLIGICVNPLAIVLELAPMGALDTQLKHYRRSGDKISAKSCQLVVLQIAKALEYLHQQHIIYRDLKSENVLVWQFPEPFSQNLEDRSPRKVRRDQEVHVRLADYGISRPTLPTGAKGFGGTEGFMAPEIVKYNGEEEYTEKVDCFSFGMFIYELLTLQQPFAGYETVKELILEGGRPPLTSRELIYPTYLLDLMVVCWAQQPRHRPSASQIVSIASAPEFLHLMDVVSLDQGSCSSVAMGKNSKLWLSLSSGFNDKSQLHILEMLAEGSWQEDIIIKSGDKIDAITSMCQVEGYIWIGDNAGFIHAFDYNSFALIFSYKMEPDLMEEPSPVRSIHYLQNIKRVCVAMHNGRLFLCDADVIPSSQSGGEGTFLVTELASDSCIHSVASIHYQNLTEIWCGLSHGVISVFTLKDGVVTGQQVINHNDPMVENVEVLQVITGDGDLKAYVWTFLYPGFHVYQWEAKNIKNRLDCSKLVPCSESLKTIAIDEHFSTGRCQVISMAIHQEKLYVGTSWGCLIITEAETLRPITVFRPYSDEVQAIIPVLKPKTFFGPKLKQHNVVENNETGVQTQNLSYVVTLGKGYRALIERYVANMKGDAIEADEDHDSSMIYAMLWQPDEWITD